MEHPRSIFLEVSCLLDGLLAKQSCSFSVRRLYFRITDSPWDSFGGSKLQLSNVTRIQTTRESLQCVTSCSQEGMWPQRQYTVYALIRFYNKITLATLATLGKERPNSRCPICGLWLLTRKVLSRFVTVVLFNLISSNWICFKSFSGFSTEISSWYFESELKF